LSAMGAGRSEPRATTARKREQEADKKTPAIAWDFPLLNPGTYLELGT
jgi:hypothetical protein